MWEIKDQAEKGTSDDKGDISEILQNIHIE